MFRRLACMRSLPLCGLRTPRAPPVVVASAAKVMNIQTTKLEDVQSGVVHCHISMGPMQAVMESA